MKARFTQPLQVFQKERGFDPVSELESELAQGWGKGARRITWPLVGRIGRVS